ncbi:Nuclear transcription factor Y subunit C-2 [Platanthera guangdongensis]|uniref:Nuclear transcription factor Y subunit C-2 n=1 Tax=Platanthera guangdongensis TaxID=2320717 RepID=A0ABR2MWF5_9ASPA
MDDNDESQQNAMNPIHIPLAPNTLQANQMMAPTNGLTTQFPYQFPPPQIPQHVQHQSLSHLDRQIQIFWANQLQEVKTIYDFKNHNLPLARIKKIMKADEDVKMIAAETPVLFSKACEMFILELTYRAWSQAEGSKRRTLQRSDVSSAIAVTPSFDFLVEIVPMEEMKETATLSSVPGSSSGKLNDIPYFYDTSKFGTMMMDMRGSEMNLDFAPQQQEQEQHLQQQQLHRGKSSQ